MFIDYALLIPLLPAFGWLMISLFSKSLGGKGSAWLATTMIGLSAVIAIGLFYVSSSLERRPVAPRTHIPSQAWCKHAVEDDPSLAK